MHYVWGILHLPSDNDAGGVKGDGVEPVEVGAVGPEEAEDHTAEATSIATASLIVTRMSLIAVEVGAIGPEEAEDHTAEATSVATASLIVTRMSLILSLKAAGVGGGGMAHGPDSE